MQAKPGPSINLVLAEIFNTLVSKYEKLNEKELNAKIKEVHRPENGGEQE